MNKDGKEDLGKLISIKIENGELKKIEKLALKYGVSVAQVARGYLRMGINHAENKKVEDFEILHSGAVSW